MVISWSPREDLAVSEDHFKCLRIAYQSLVFFSKELKNYNTT